MQIRLLVILLLALPLLTFAQETRDPQNVMTVTGTSQVFASPDEAMVRLGVQEQSSTAAEAQAKANVVVQKLIDSLVAMKIAKTNVQTSRMSLTPVYSNPAPGGTSRITGYQAQDVISVRLSDFAMIGKVIDAGTAAGVNVVEGIDFQLRNARGPRAQAYKDAVADARSKADAIADALGMKIAGVYDVHAESGGYAPQPQMMGRMRMDAVGTPVEPGQMEVTVTVTVRYRLG